MPNIIQTRGWLECYPASPDTVATWLQSVRERYERGELTIDPDAWATSMRVQGYCTYLFFGADFRFKQIEELKLLCQEMIANEAFELVAGFFYLQSDEASWSIRVEKGQIIDGGDREPIEPLYDNFL